MLSQTIARKHYDVIPLIIIISHEKDLICTLRRPQSNSPLVQTKLVPLPCYRLECAKYISLLFVSSRILLTEIHAQKCSSLNPTASISRNPQEVSETAQTKNFRKTIKQLDPWPVQKWNLCRHITAREVFCCCIFGGTLRQK